ncbi:heterokaryon incompatibility protein [Diplodia corticola]|uniref:Heterokaryon incompatibility protein n=1 Tax=Diplodia corticola TaxID=236234 RepID=A0A1J9RTD4_9PEZI|nr:heterokaryon incompatibility protein [Diplodia corticola]OJD30789.1 heterokaryon incompatibility protein [Diplodia corticola]
MYSTLHCQEIRLLKIINTESDGEIRCRLVHASLPNKPSFIALSYAWSSAKRGRTIFVNDQEYPVTFSAYDALKRIRQTFGTTTVWIDAICINQNDEMERNTQVQMMQKIFASAEKTVVFLGEVRDSSLSMQIECEETAPASIFFPGNTSAPMLEKFVVHCSSSKTPKQSRSMDAINVFCLIQSMAETHTLENTSPFDSASKAVGGCRYQRRLFEALREMTRSRWWNRMWTVQEVVVPKEVLVIYGCCVTNWKTFVQAATRYSHQSSLLPWEYSNILDGFSHTVLQIENMRSSWVSGGRKGTPLLSLLRNFTHRKATDDRDRVYALLGLAQAPLPIDPDYTLDVPEVYKNTTLGIIKRTGSLNILNGDIGRKDRQDLPSWVPDWAAIPHHLDRRRAGTAYLYNASLKSFVYVQVGILKQPLIIFDHSTGSRRGGRLRVFDHGTISLPGLGLAEVSDISSANITDGNLTSILQSWAKMAARGVGDPNKWGSFLRTMCADVVYVNKGSERSCRRMRPDDLVAVAAWFLNRPGAPLDEAVSEDSDLLTIRTALLEQFPGVQEDRSRSSLDVDYSVRSATVGRSFFLTEAGFFGLGPMQMAKNDGVYLMLGARTPMLLRAKKYFFELIGDCFAHGYMDGEAMSSWDKISSEPRQRNFWIDRLKDLKGRHLTAFVEVEYHPTASNAEIAYKLGRELDIAQLYARHLHSGLEICLK